jgi:hypothetical protein
LGEEELETAEGSATMTDEEYTKRIDAIKETFRRERDEFAGERVRANAGVRTAFCFMLGLGLEKAGD